ncbi:MAG: SHOCT domain-containing protein [Thermoleophilaceae bacterium]|jgi:hypothetical protein
MAGKRRAEQEAEPAAPPPAAPAAPPSPASAGGISPSTLDQLEQLGKLHEQGVLTDDEFAQQKAKLLA